MASPLRALSLHPSEVKAGFVLVLGTSVPGTISSAKSRSAAARANVKPLDKRLPFWNQRPLPHCEHFRSRGSTLSGTAPRCLQLGQMIAISMDLLNSAIMSGSQDGGSYFLVCNPPAPRAVSRAGVNQRGTNCPSGRTHSPTEQCGEHRALVASRPLRHKGGCLPQAASFH